MRLPSLRLRSGQAFSGQRGVALIITLLVVTLLVTLILEFGNTMRIEARAAANFRDDLKAYYIARAGVTFARGVLEEDAGDPITKDHDALTELWAQRLPPIPLGEGTVLVEITDEEGKINVNKLTGGTSPSPLNEVFRHLLESQEADDPQKILDSIVDWTDSNADVTGGGAENSHYEGLDDPYTAKNGPLDSLAELRLIQGVEDDTFNRLKDFLTLYGSGAVNVNTAPREVLRALSEDWSDAMVDQILTFQKESPFEKKLDLKDKVIGEEDLYNRVQGLIDVKSSFFSIRSQGEVNGVHKTIRAVVERPSQKSTVIRYWRVE